MRVQSVIHKDSQQLRQAENDLSVLGGVPRDPGCYVSVQWSIVLQ